MLPLRLKYEPVFSIEKDILQIRSTLPADSEPPPHLGKMPTASNIVPLPSARAYILTSRLKPVAIFDGLGYEDFGAFVKLTLCMMANNIDNPDCYRDVEVMNQIRPYVRSKACRKPYRAALFYADKIVFHLSIPVDLMIHLCTYYRQMDIVDRDIWAFVSGTID